MRITAILLGCLLLAPIVGRAQARGSCPAAPVDSAAVSHDTALPAIFIRHYEQLSLLSVSGCQTFVVANDSVREGFLALFDSAGRLIDSWNQYRLASGLQRAGRNRIAFEYTVGASVGERERALQVFCSFTPGYWVPCHSEAIELVRWIAPPGVEGFNPSLSWRERATYRIRRDTLYLHVTGYWERHDSLGSTVASGRLRTRELSIALP